MDAWIVRHGWTLVQQRLRLRLCTSNNAVYSGVFDIFTLDCSKSWSLIVCLYKTKATRPRPRPELQDRGQDQDQTCKTKTKTAAYKTKTKTSFCGSETGLVTRPRSQTISLVRGEEAHSLLALWARENLRVVSLTMRLPRYYAISLCLYRFTASPMLSSISLMSSFIFIYPFLWWSSSLPSSFNM